MSRSHQLNSHNTFLHAENISNFTTGCNSKMKGIMGSRSQTQLLSQQNKVKVKSELMLILSFLNLVVNGLIVSAHELDLWIIDLNIQNYECSLLNGIKTRGGDCRRLPKSVTRQNDRLLKLCPINKLLIRDVTSIYKLVFVCK